MRLHGRGCEAPYGADKDASWSAETLKYSINVDTSCATQPAFARAMLPKVLAACDRTAELPDMSFSMTACSKELEISLGISPRTSRSI